MEMHIPAEFQRQILSMDVDGDPVYWSRQHWLNSEHVTGGLAKDIEALAQALPDKFGRREIAEFYATDAPLRRKFVAAMIWGYESPDIKKRDGRGPWRVAQMMGSWSVNGALFESIDVKSENAIRDAYNTVHERGLTYCGPSFFTKHFYFLGRSHSVELRPLILDDRVVAGIGRLLLEQFPVAAAILRLRPINTGDAYVEYLRFARGEAERLGCTPDQIELFLFSHGRDTPKSQRRSRTKGSRLVRFSS